MSATVKIVPFTPGRSAPARPIQLIPATPCGIADQWNSLTVDYCGGGGEVDDGSFTYAPDPQARHAAADTADDTERTDTFTLTINYAGTSLRSGASAVQDVTRITSIA